MNEKKLRKENGELKRELRTRARAFRKLDEAHHNQIKINAELHSELRELRQQTT